MFPPPADVLRDSEGSLRAAPLPLLLHALCIQERTCTLSLTADGIDKRVYLEEGIPVACQSNLLHEAIGPFLVSRGKLTDADYQLAYAESMSTGEQVSTVFRRRKLIGAVELAREMRAAVAVRILDCFRWSDGHYRIQPTGAAADSAIRMNPRQLLLRGVLTHSPYDVVARPFTGGRLLRFVPLPGPLPETAELKLGELEHRVLDVIGDRLTCAEMAAALGAEESAVARRLYAFVILGMVAVVEEERVEPVPAVEPAPGHPGAMVLRIPRPSPSTSATAEAPGSASEPTGAPEGTVGRESTAAGGSTAAGESTATQERSSGQEAAPVVTPSLDLTGTREPVATVAAGIATVPDPATAAEGEADPEAAPEGAEVESLEEILAATFIDHRQRDAFELLGVAVDASPREIRRAYLALADWFVPSRFGETDLQEKAEELLVAYARAFVTLSDPDQRVRALQRRASRLARLREGATGGEQGIPESEYLDAVAIFREGQTRLEQGNLWGAAESFQKAARIDPRSLYEAYLAWARHQLNPKRGIGPTLRALSAAAEAHPDHPEVQFFLGEVCRAHNQPERALEAYRKAQKAAPEVHRYAERLRELEERQKGGLLSRVFRRSG